MISMVSSFAVILGMSCTSAGFTHPWDKVLLGFFTLAESVMVGIACAGIEPNIVFEALGITAALVLALTLFTFQTKYDFMSVGGGLYFGLWMLLLVSPIPPCERNIVPRRQRKGTKFFRAFLIRYCSNPTPNTVNSNKVGMFSWFLPMSKPVYIVYLCFGIILFCGYVVYDTQLILTRGEAGMVDAPAMAALALYLDILNLFLYIVREFWDLGDSSESSLVHPFRSIFLPTLLLQLCHPPSVPVSFLLLVSYLFFTPRASSSVAALR